jgi:FkbM family methyltransferase
MKTSSSGWSQNAKANVKRLLARLDVHAGRHRHTLAGAREALLKADVELTLDVGAHAGEYGRGLRACGYRGQIVSFEPVRRQFERLTAAAAGDDAWECQNRAAGARAETATINVSGNDGFSSSLLAMKRAHEQAVGESRYEGTETIEVVSLDEALADRMQAQPRSYLKIDTQGYEHQVLAGTARTLQHCLAVELELSLTPLYEGQLLIGEMIELMRGHGFHPTHLEQEFTDPHSGELLQVNGLFQASARITGENGR